MDINNFLLLSPIDERLKKNLSALHRQMHDMRKSKNQKYSKDYRRCNRCGKYFSIKQTTITKYCNNSHRKYRLCELCKTHLSKTGMNLDDYEL